MAVGEPAGEGEAFLEGFDDIADDDAALEQVPDLVADGLGQSGDVGEGDFAGFTVDPIGLSYEPCGFGASVGDSLDIHGQNWRMNQ